jgi:hypothetical protein
MRDVNLEYIRNSRNSIINNPGQREWLICLPVAHLPSTYEAVSSNPSTYKKKEKVLRKN